MDNQAVYLSPQEWQHVLGLLSYAPWREANPLMMKIGEQLRAQQLAPPNIADNPANFRGNGPNKDAGHGGTS